MARKTIYKKRPRTRWSVNLQTVNFNTAVPVDSDIFSSQIICFNPSKATGQPIEQLYTVKNVEFSFRTIFYGNTEGKFDNVNDLTAYIMYIPAGSGISNNVATDHPEWILAYKFLGNPMVKMNENAPIRIRSRLARKLHSGDSIYFILKGTNSGRAVIDLQTNGIVKYYTKSN